MSTFHHGATLLTVFLSVVVSACHRSPSAPSFELRAKDGPAAAVPPAITLELRGRVVDDLNQPVPGVVVTLSLTHAPDPIQPGSSITDDSGAFVLTAAVISNVGSLDEVPIRLDRDGYERAHPWIRPSSDTTVTMYPTATIHSGHTLRTRMVATAPYGCGVEPQRCRRIAVEPSGAEVIVELIESDGEDVGLVDDEPPRTPFDYQRRVTVTDGEAFIIGGPATVTLRARHPAQSLLGQYTLTLTHGCTEVPEVARTRTYTASIEPVGSGYVVTLSGAEFLRAAGCTSESRLGCHQFLAARDEDHVRFDLIGGEWHGGYITERIPPDGWLVALGSAEGRLESGTIAATGSGHVSYCTTSQPNPFPCDSYRSCEVTDLHLSFARK